MTQLYIAWTKYQRRPVTMSEHFGFKLHFLPGLSLNNSLFKVALGYPLQAIKTIVLLLKERPKAVWIQCPPNILLHITWFARLLGLRKMLIIADLHNSALSKMWLSLPFTRRLLNTSDLILVHNDHIAETAAVLGIARHKICVLEDRIPVLSATHLDVRPNGRPTFVMPCSFRKDEPIRVVLEAARQLPEFDFLVTGDQTRAIKLGYLQNKPDNVTFTDYLSIAGYEKLLTDATGILCLTTGEGIQLSAAIEAVASGKPMIISDTLLLRSLFATGFFVDNLAATLRDACRAVADDYPRYAENTRTLRDDTARRSRWTEQSAIIAKRLTDCYGVDFRAGNLSERR